MSNIDQELNSQLSAWTIQCVIHHDESFVDPLCDLRRLNSGQPGERCLIPPIELVDVFNQRHFLILRNNAKSYSNLLYDFYFASD
ncbi:hypothetical protein ACH8HJ_004341, partial [Escherichia coli]